MRDLFIKKKKVKGVNEIFGKTYGFFFFFFFAPLPYIYDIQT